MSPPKTAILLAAGRARRLGTLTDDRPKCLLPLGGRTLLEHQVASLKAGGVERVVVVTGYLAPQVEEVGGPELAYVHNPIFETTNSIYSLHLAADHGAGGFVLANADVLFHPRLLEALLRAKAPDALLYEPGDSLGEEEMKVRIEQGRVRAFGKNLPPGSYHGENLGVLKFSARAAALLFRAVADLVEAGDVNAWAPKAYERICGEVALHALPTRGLPWIEIDFPHDYERARSVVWPRIERDVAAAAERDAGATPTA